MEGDEEKRPPASSVSKIVGHRYISGILEYRVRWEGSESTEDEWFTSTALHSRQPGLSHDEQKERNIHIQSLLDAYNKLSSSQDIPDLKNREDPQNEEKIGEIPQVEKIEKDEVSEEVLSFLKSLGLEDSERIPRLQLIKGLLKLRRDGNTSTTANDQSEETLIARLLKPAQWASIFASLDSEQKGFFTKTDLIGLQRESRTLAALLSGQTVDRSSVVDDFGKEEEKKEEEEEFLLDPSTRDVDEKEEEEKTTEGEEEKTSNGEEEEKGDEEEKTEEEEKTTQGEEEEETQQNSPRPDLEEEKPLLVKYPALAKIWGGMQAKKGGGGVRYEDILQELQLNFDLLEVLEQSSTSTVTHQTIRHAIFTKLFKAMDIRSEKKHDGTLTDEYVRFTDFLAVLPQEVLKRKSADNSGKNKKQISPRSEKNALQAKLNTSSQNISENKSQKKDPILSFCQQDEEEIIEQEIQRRVDQSALSKIASFNSMQLHRVPRAVLLATHLTDLSLKGNFITTVPTEIYLLTNLVRLCLSRNALTSLPSTLGLLHSLQLLDVSCNQLCDLPDEISQLGQLRHLDISSNTIELLPYSLGRGCLQLEKLLCFGNPLQVEVLEKLHEGLPVLLTYLQACYLIEEEQKAKVREEVAIQRKTSVYGEIITDPTVTELPSVPLDQDALLLANYRMAEFLPQTQRRVVDARMGFESDKSRESRQNGEPGKNKISTGTVIMENMGLRELPGKLFTTKKKFGPASIFSLNVSHNLRVTSLPPEMGRLENLVYLNASNCALSSLPTEIGKLTNLRTMNVAVNRLRVISPCIEKLEKLEVLDLSDNSISLIPHFLSNLTCLHSISLHGNKCEELKESRASLQILRDEGITAFQVFFYLDK